VIGVTILSKERGRTKHVRGGCLNMSSKDIQQMKERRIKARTLQKRGGKKVKAQRVKIRTRVGGGKSSMRGRTRSASWKRRKEVKRK